MGQALIPIERCNILADYPDLEFREGPYRSSIRRDKDRSALSLTDGRQTLTVPLLWAFGQGRAGQTYVFEYRGALYESRLSFYKALGSLDLTMGAVGSTPAGIEGAAGRLMKPGDARDCFRCHAPDTIFGERLHLDDVVPGVGCVNCHTGADKHASAIQSGDSANAKVRKLSTMSAEEMNELCGRCHRTWSEISLNGPRGVNNVRFQPYRLTNSKCYDPGDIRIRCTACHDPHAGVDTNRADYDRACTACHTGTARSRNCPVANHDCVRCHMPKLELPGSHSEFTDHQIRVVRPGEPYPN